MARLELLLERLNKEIDSYNAELQEAIDDGDIRPDEGERLRVAPGSATVEMVRSATRSRTLMRAVQHALSREHPHEIVRMANVVKEKKQETPITRELRKGSKHATGMRDVLVRTVDLAHLVALVGE